LMPVPCRPDNIPFFGDFFCILPLTFQLLESVPFFTDTSQREERLWNDR
jgi:hypothetical protein